MPERDAEEWEVRLSEEKGPGARPGSSRMGFPLGLAERRFWDQTLKRDIALATASSVRYMEAAKRRASGG